MDSAKAAHDAIAQLDDLTARRALVAVVVSRRGTLLTNQERREWMKRDASSSDMLVMWDFPQLADL
jgi:hypothetical protein